jgi:phosphonopyruvate decarboxylase
LGRLITRLAQLDSGYFPVNNEGEAVAVAAGARLSGRRPVVLMQNSGLGNAVNPIASLLVPSELGVLFVVSWRGRPGHTDEPQHHLMGAVTPPLLELLSMDHALVDRADVDFDALLARAEQALNRGRSFALLTTAGVFE